MSTHKIDESSQEFLEKLTNGSVDELNELKAFLFKENIRIEMEKKELLELKQQIIEDRKRLRDESDEVNQQIVIERKRLRDEEMFFDKKMKILKNGFESLEMDRKIFAKAKKQFEADKLSYAESAVFSKNEEFAVYLFNGVSNLMSLKKRYKDLLKIFHPDNMAGDHEMVLIINRVYEDLKKGYENNKIV